MRSRRAATPAPTSSVVESPWRDSEDRPVSPEAVLDYYADPANRPAAGSPEWRDLKQQLEEFTKTLAERGNPLAGSFRDFCEEFSDTSEMLSPPAPSPATVTAPPSGGGRHLEVLTIDLNEVDLISFVQDRSWDEDSHRAFVDELARREAEGRIDPRNAGAVRIVLQAAKS